MTLEQIADKLSDLDKSLLLGEEKGWGSWMMESGSYMVSLGLGTKRDGSIYFDTPLAKQMIEYLTSPTPNPTLLGNDMQGTEEQKLRELRERMMVLAHNGDRVGRHKDELVARAKAFTEFVLGVKENS